ncbi:MAG: hypothetical protein C4576_15490 [Desulfobacteraceae bacterium]|nr:MAG: hypothetical protein C4576_15490 [Desulfobacteraceae bacterium]
MSRGDAGDVRETPEKGIVRMPERRIGTYDDLGTADDRKGIETYDDLHRQGAERSINTYDDLRAPKDSEDKNTAKVSDAPRHDAPESVEQHRIGQAAEAIRGHERMNAEKWRALSVDDKKSALESAGKELGRAYNSPEPPLETRNMGDPDTQGEYGDGYSYDARTHKVVGSDYGIRMNEDAIAKRNEKLFGDDPRTALETYSHEFRHSYQAEQARAYDKGFRVDNAEQAKTWSENFRDYKQPPDAQLAQTDPEEYFKKYEAYRSQPLERDARGFAERVTSNTYHNRFESGDR